MVLLQFNNVEPQRRKKYNILTRFFRRKNKYLNIKEKKKNAKILKIRRVFKEWIWQPLFDDTVQFCSTTSVQGLRHIVAEGVHPVERIFWFIMVVCLSYYGFILGMVQINRYTINPTVVSIQKNFRDWTTTFPAVTVCLSERIDSEMARKYIEKKWNVTEDHEKYQYYYDFVGLVAKTSFRANLRLYWRYDKDQIFDDIDLMSIIAAVVPPTQIRTSLHNRQHKVIWETVVTEMGVCRTFNSIFSRYQSVETYKLQLKNKNSFSSATNEDQLLKCHYMNKQCYARFNIVNNTGQYFVHSPYEVAESISNPTGVIEEGEELDSEFRASYMLAGDEVRTLNVKQRSCKYPDEATSRFIPAHSNALCQMECRSRLALVFCGCRPFFYIVGEGKPCDAKGMSCIGRNMEILINIPANLAKCSCVPQCTEINYMPYSKKLSLWNASRISVFDIKATVKFALKTPKILMHKDLIFTFEDLIASIGGTSALFLGISFLSVVEILLCFCKPVRRSLANLRDGKKNK
ncbi:pickpocket protein 28-like [Arctopsyche grandis]|uniref:pickpocket protein 28-like n=1 Tax=Arctopsyche grandis TaxID=121162 RepID=UPI00406D657B